MTLFIILDLIGVFLIIKWLAVQIKEYKQIANKSEFFRLKRFRFILLFCLIFFIPLLIVNFTPIETDYHISNELLRQNNVLYSVSLSLFISAVWFMYIYKLDVFEKEKKRYLFLIFALSSIFTLLAEIPYEAIHHIGFTNTEEPIQSFLYSVFGIGLIEETIKFIPLLIILRFTKVIDEPYDYILYASCSAIGFSFVENAMYLYNYGIEIINARALYASVAHMTFSSMIAYGLFLIKFKKTKFHRILVFGLFYFLAIFSHGFYDFWLINVIASKYSGLTTLFFLATVHIWFIMKNNTINSSNFYSKSNTINNDKLKVYLIISLLVLFMFSYVYVAFKWDSGEANQFLIRSTVVYGFTIFYLIATLSKFNLVEGLLRPFKLSFGYLIPKKKK
jgi:RsiW-degrading membrane proteinase PrsW (M82 family)